MPTKNEMITASQDLQTTFSLEPPLNMEGTWQELLDGLLEFKEEMTPQEVNQMRPETYKVLQEVSKESKPSETRPIPSVKKPVKKTEPPDFREPEKVEVKPVEVKPKVIPGKPEKKKRGITRSQALSRVFMQMSTTKIGKTKEQIVTQSRDIFEKENGVPDKNDAAAQLRFDTAAGILKALGLLVRTKKLYKITFTGRGKNE